MRRLIVLLIMLVVPLQFAWAAAASVHGHIGENVAALGVHAHEHDHDQHAHGQPAPDVAGDAGKNAGEDGHHGNHCHHVLSFIPPESGLTPGLMPSGGPLPHPLEVFFSRTPPLLDRPPLARA